MKTVYICEKVGSFAEDKDAAARIRDEILLPALHKREKVKLVFTGVSLATQSFMHALIAQGLFAHGEEVLGLLEFKGCEPSVKGIVETVVQYVLEARDDEA